MFSPLSVEYLNDLRGASEQAVSQASRCEGLWRLWCQGRRNLSSMATSFPSPRETLSLGVTVTCHLPAPYVIQPLLS